MLQALLALEYLNNTQLPMGAARVFTDPPVLSVRDAQNQIVGFKGQIAIFNELKTYQEQLIQYYSMLNTQQNISSDTTNNSPLITDIEDNQGQQPSTPIPNRMPFSNANANKDVSKRGTLRRTMGDLRRSTLGYGGRHTKKQKKAKRRSKKRKNNRRYSRKN
jgi:hypothetical protein